MPKTATKKKPQTKKKVAKAAPKKAAPKKYWYRVEKVFGRPPKSVTVGMQLGMPYKDKHGSYTIVNTKTGKLVWGFSGTYVGREPEKSTA